MCLFREVFIRGSLMMVTRLPTAPVLRRARYGKRTEALRGELPCFSNQPLGVTPGRP